MMTEGTKTGRITVRPERRGRARPGRTPVKASPVAPSLPPPRHAWPAPPGAHAGVCRAGAPRAQRAAREAAGQWSSVALFVSRLRGVRAAGRGKPRPLGSRRLSETWLSEAVTGTEVCRRPRGAARASGIEPSAPLRPVCRDGGRGLVPQPPTSYPDPLRPSRPNPALSAPAGAPDGTIRRVAKVGLVLEDGEAGGSHPRSGRRRECSRSPPGSPEDLGQGRPTERAAVTRETGGAREETVSRGQTPRRGTYVI